MVVREESAMYVEREKVGLVEGRHDTDLIEALSLPCLQQWGASRHGLAEMFMWDRASGSCQWCAVIVGRLIGASGCRHQNLNSCLAIEMVKCNAHVLTKAERFVGRRGLCSIDPLKRDDIFAFQRY